MNTKLLAAAAAVASLTLGVATNNAPRRATGGRRRG